MNLDSVMKIVEKPVVDANFVKETALKYFPTMQAILQNSDQLTQEEEEDLKKQREKAEQELQRLQMEQEICESNIEEMHHEMEEAENRHEDPVDVVRDKAVETIEIVAGTKYNRFTIQKKVEAVISTFMKKKHLLYWRKSSPRLLKGSYAASLTPGRIILLQRQSRQEKPTK